MNCTKCGKENISEGQNCSSCNTEAPKETTTTNIKKPRRSWFLWWIINEEELKFQVENYNTLSVFKSAEGQSALLLLLSALTTSLFIIIGLGALDKGAYLDVGLMLVLASFIYRGHKWAMIGAIILWTFEKFYFVFETNTGNPALQIIWWAVYMSAFWLALKVEKERKPKQQL